MNRLIQPWQFSLTDMVMVDVGDSTIFLQFDRNLQYELVLIDEAFDHVKKQSEYPLSYVVHRFSDCDKWFNPNVDDTLDYGDYFYGKGESNPKFKTDSGNVLLTSSVFEMVHHTVLKLCKWSTAVSSISGVITDVYLTQYVPNTLIKHPKSQIIPGGSQQVV